MKRGVWVAGVTLLFVSAVGVGGWYVRDHFVPKVSTKTSTTGTMIGLPTVLRTLGGTLDAAYYRSTEQFSRKNTKEIGPISLGTTTSEIQVSATFRYHLPLAKEWPLTWKDKLLIVKAPEIAPTLPVAFDSSTLVKRTKGGWARFDKHEQLDALERSITSELGVRAESPAYREWAREAARRTAVEFVSVWLLKMQLAQSDSERRVVVLFPGETWPSRTPLH